MGYRRDLKNKEQILHFPHIVRRLSILFYSFTNKIFNDTAVGAPHTPRSEHRRLPSKDHSESKPRRRVLSQQLDPRVVEEFSIPDLPRSFLLTPTEPLTPSQSSHVSFEVEQYPENDVNSSETKGSQTLTSFNSLAGNKPKIGLVYYLHLLYLYHLNCRHYHPMMDNQNLHLSPTLLRLAFPPF